MLSKLDTVGVSSMFTASPSKGHVAFPTNRSTVRKELEEGEKKRKKTGENTNEQPGKTKRCRKEKRKEKIK